MRKEKLTIFGLVKSMYDVSRNAHPLKDDDILQTINIDNINSELVVVYSPTFCHANGHTMCSLVINEKKENSYILLIDNIFKSVLSQSTQDFLIQHMVGHIMRLHDTKDAHNLSPIKAAIYRKWNKNTQNEIMDADIYAITDGGIYKHTAVKALNEIMTKVSVDNKEFKSRIKNITLFNKMKGDK